MASKVQTPTKITVYRFVAGVVLVALGGAATLFADHLPWLGALSTGVGLVVGKFLLVPHSDVIKMGLQLMAPEKAVEVTVSALQSLPPDRAEEATAKLMASLPPEARARASMIPPAPNVPTVISFVGATEPPPDVDSK